jgi:hypothetical protein
LDSSPHVAPARVAAPAGGGLIAILLAVGVALRLWQYLADTSMWFDELSIARNITERSLTELMTQPLGYAQTAPLGFLAAVDISSTIFGPNDLSLRIFPFLCGIAGLILFWRLAAEALEGIAVPIALLLFAVSAPLIRYSTELKQYGADIVVILGLTLVALRLCVQPPTSRRCVIAGVLGFVSILFSQAAVLVLAGLGAALTLRWILDRSAGTVRPVRITLPLWAVAAASGLVIARAHTAQPTLAFMHWFWRSRQGFLPLPFTAGGTAIWLRDRFTQFFDAMSGYPWPLVFTLLAVLGFVSLWRQRRDVALLLLGPLLVTLAAAVAQQYPFRARVVLFLLPTFLLSAAASIAWIADWIAKRNPALAGAAVVVALIPPIASSVIRPPPYTTEQFKPVLAYVRAHRQAGDRIYVYSNAYEGVARYARLYGLEPGSYVNGTCADSGFRSYYEDVDRFRGAPRVWVVSSSVPDFAPARRALSMYLETIGTRKDSLNLPSVAPMSPVSAELYDLSDAMRLDRASAATFEAPTGSVMHAICFDWIRPTTGITSPR